MVERLDATLTTVERLERFEGHLLNWYDTRTLAPLRPALRLDRGQRQSRRRARHAGVGAAATGVRPDRAPTRRPTGCAIWRARAGALFDAMDFRPLYDARRQLFAVGYRLADADERGPARRRRATTCSPPKRGWRASWRSARATCPSRTGSISAAPSTAVHGAPVLLSWTRDAVRVPDAAAADAHLSGHAARRVVPAWPSGARSTTARRAACPWGISESAYSAVDRHGTYQYKAFGVPGLGLKRGLGDELVVAPYAIGARGDAGARRRARRTCGDSPRSVSRATTGSSTPSTTPIARRTAPRRRPIADAGHRAHLHGASPGHDAGRAGQRAARRSHGRRGFTPTRACRPPSCCCRNGGRARCRPTRACPPTTCSVAAPPPLPVRRYRTPHTVFPHAQALSNGRLVSVVTNAGGGSLLRDDLAVTRSRRDATLDPGSAVHLPARRLERRRLVADVSSDRASSRTTTW